MNRVFRSLVRQSLAAAAVAAALAGAAVQSATAETELVVQYTQPQIFDGVFAALIMVVSSFLMFPSRGLRLEWDSPTVMELFHFGKWVVLGTALTFLGRQGDSLIVSRFLDFETLGVFSIAISFAKLVEMLAERFSWSLLFPVYSEMKSNVADAFTRNTTRLRLAIYAICFPIVLFLSLGGRVFIDVLYDDPVVDELEARGCGMFGPGFEIEPAGYEQVKQELAGREVERLARLATLRGL